MHYQFMNKYYLIIGLVVIIVLSAIFLYKQNRELFNSFDFDEIVSVKNADDQGNYELILGIKRTDSVNKAIYVLRDSKAKNSIYDVLQVDNKFYGAPTQRIVKTDKGDFLVVRHLNSKGTGLLQYDETWYSTTFNFRKVLEYPSDGHNFFTSYNDGLKFKSSTAITDNGVDVIYDFEYYSRDNSNKLIGTAHKKASFIWDKDNWLLNQDETKSEITASELERILVYKVIE